VPITRTNTQEKNGALDEFACFRAVFIYQPTALFAKASGKQSISTFNVKSRNSVPGPKGIYNQPLRWHLELIITSLQPERAQGKDGSVGCFLSTIHAILLRTLYTQRSSLYHQRLSIQRRRDSHRYNRINSSQALRLPARCHFE